MELYGTATTTASTNWASWNYYYVIDSGTSTTTASSTWADIVWLYWNSDRQEWDHGQQRQQTPEELAEAARLARERQAEHQRQAEEQDKIAQQAEIRAEQLLKENLAPSQREEFEREKAFTVISKDGQRKYRIRKGWSHNVEHLDANGKKLATLCAHPVEAVPHHDNMLAQKLMLEHDEERFLRIANRKTA